MDVESISSAAQFKDSSGFRVFEELFDFGGGEGACFTNPDGTPGFVLVVHNGIWRADESRPRVHNKAEQTITFRPFESVVSVSLTVPDAVVEKLMAADKKAHYLALRWMTLRIDLVDEDAWSFGDESFVKELSDEDPSLEKRFTAVLRLVELLANAGVPVRVVWGRRTLPAANA